MQLEGIVNGIVDSQSDVSVGTEGNFEGTLSARSVVVRGHVQGKVVCERLEIEPSGRVIGEVHAETMTIAAGGRFHGQSHERGASADADQSPKEDEDFLRSLSG